MQSFFDVVKGFLKQTKKKTFERRHIAKIESPNDYKFKYIEDGSINQKMLLIKSG